MAQDVGTFLAAAFQYAVKGALLTIKSYIVRTALLGFFFVLLPLAKMAAVQAWLVAVALGWLPHLDEILDSWSVPAQGRALDGQGALQWFLGEVLQAMRGTYQQIDDLIMA